MRRLIPLALVLTLSSTAMADPSLSTLRAELLGLVNADRAAAGLDPVRLDPLASYVAQGHAEEMSANGYISHINLSGLKPYHRWALAGGIDHVRENVYRLSVEGGSPSEEFDPAVAESSWMESPGHRANILAPEHTHLGIGIAFDEKTGQASAVQLFVDRYVAATVEWIIDPSGGAGIRVRGAVRDPSMGPYFLAVSRDPLPRALGPDEVPFGPYQDYGTEEIANLGPWDMDVDLETMTFSAEASLKREPEPGLYYVILYLRDADGIPYELRPGEEVSVSTEDAIPATSFILVWNEDE